MHQYLNLLEDVFWGGEWTETRPGIRAKTVLGGMFQHDLSEGFPLLTTKKVFLRGVAEELFWFLSGSTNVKPLQERGVHIWDEWASPTGNVGLIYGYQWRHGFGVDQITKMIEEVRTNPKSRQNLVLAWNPTDLPDMSLPPCHFAFQVRVLNGKVNLIWYQRSADLFLGVPFNIASYALLAHMIAHQTDLEVGTLVGHFGDMHIYENHMSQVGEQLGRELRDLPALEFTRLPNTIFNYKWEDIKINGYHPHPPIRGEVAI